MAHKRPDIAENSGDRKSIKSYKEFRRCKVCQKYLTRYNPSDYCFVHQAEGHKIAQAKLIRTRDRLTREANEKRKNEKEKRNKSV